MKNKASVVLKQIISLLSSLGSKAKSRTNAAKARLIMFSLMKNKKVLMDSLSHKIHNLLGNHHHKDNHDDHGVEEDLSKAIILYNAKSNDNGNFRYSSANSSHLVERYYNYDDEEEEEDKYPDLRHSLFDEFDEDDQDLQGGSVIDMVRNSKEEGEDFKLEDEIDRVADLFITRFHKHMRLQKLESFKRYQEMLQRGL
ncbi:transcription elongation factor [Parasponia andersonii]|uniref:Transcription elongation factor n=1 Tax=Parasponia andersonii TaxID=3476 RepID=A0A2P5AW67_PARAD|nr:transcription elongation factor [Parasponia andersonii]